MIKYSTPEMEIVAIDTEDVILASTGTEGPGNEMPDDEW